MTYDFTSIMNRHGGESIAVDGWETDPGFAPTRHATVST